MLEEGGVGLVKLGYKCQTAEDLERFEQRSQRFGATTGRVSKGENLTVGDGVRIELPSEQVIELYTEMEFTGTDTGSLNPEAWPRNVRGRGQLDRPRADAGRGSGAGRAVLHGGPGLPARERAVTDPVHPELIGTWMYCGESPHDIAFIKGPNGKLHHFAFTWATGTTSSRPATSSRWTTSRSTSGRPGTGSPGA